MVPLSSYQHGNYSQFHTLGRTFTDIVFCCVCLCLKTSRTKRESETYMGNWLSLVKVSRVFRVVLTLNFHSPEFCIVRQCIVFRPSMKPNEPSMKPHNPPMKVLVLQSCPSCQDAGSKHALLFVACLDDIRYPQWGMLTPSSIRPCWGDL